MLVNAYQNNIAFNRPTFAMSIYLRYACTNNLIDTHLSMACSFLAWTSIEGLYIYDIGHMGPRCLFLPITCFNTHDCDSYKYHNKYSANENLLQHNYIGLNYIFPNILRALSHMNCLLFFQKQKTFPIDFLIISLTNHRTRKHYE